MPVLFVFLSFRGVRVLPDNKEATKAQLNKDNTSVGGAAAYFLVLFGSIGFSVFEALWVIWDPNAC